MTSRIRIKEEAEVVVSTTSTKANKKVMADGSSAGLVTGAALSESLRNKRENEASKFQDLIAKSRQGQSSNAIIRDSKTGMKVDANLERLKRREEEAKEAERLEKYQVEI